MSAAPLRIFTVILFSVGALTVLSPLSSGAFAADPQPAEEVSTTATAAAEEEGDGAEPAVAASDEPKPDAAPAEQKSTPPRGKPSADVFVPTEEISEDFAVSFPVDI